MARLYGAQLAFLAQCHFEVLKIIPTFADVKSLFMPTVLFIFGIRFFFYPNDHEPIHVHIEYQGNSAKIQVVPEIVVIENNGLKAQTIKKALETVNFYREDIVTEWHKVFDR